MLDDDDAEEQDPPRPDPHLPLMTAVLLVIVAASQVFAPLPVSVLVRYGVPGAVAGLLFVPQLKVLTVVGAAVFLLGMLAFTPHLINAGSGTWVWQAWLVEGAAMALVVSADMLIWRKKASNRAHPQ